jgi:hypothetical protein
MTPPHETTAFADVFAGIAETVRVLETLIERWPLDDRRQNALAGTLRWLAECIEAGVPLSPPSPAALRQFAHQREEREQ